MGDPVLTDFFKKEIFEAIQRKYKSKEHHWAPQPGIGLCYKTIKGINEKELARAIQNEVFTIENLTIRFNTVDGGTVKFILNNDPFTQEDEEKEV